MIESLTDIKELLYEKKKASLLKGMQEEFISGETILNVLGYLENEINDKFLLLKLSNIKKEYLKYDKDFSFILLNNKIIKEEELIFFKDTDRFDDAIENLLKNRSIEEKTITSLIIFESWLPLLSIVSFFFVFPPSIEFVKYITEEYIVNFGVKITYPYIMKHAELYYYVGTLIVFFLICLVFSYYYLLNTNISLFYKIFKNKGYEDLFSILSLLDILSEKRISEKEAAYYISKEIKIKELKRYFYKISIEEKNLIQSLSYLNLPINITHNVIKKYSTGILYEINPYNKQRWIDIYILMCKNKINNTHEFYKNNFLLIGIKYFFYLILIICVFITYLLMNDYIKNIFNIFNGSTIPGASF